MNFIMRFDLYVLNACQQFSDWLTRTFGIGQANMKVAYGLLLALIAVWTVPILFLTRDWRVVIPSLGCALMIGFMLFVFFYLPNLKEDGTVRKNPYRHLGFRLMFWFFFLFDTMNESLPSLIFLGRLTGDMVISITATLLTLAFVYFISCSGLPPQKGRVRAWIEEHVPSLARPEVAPGPA